MGALPKRRISTARKGKRRAAIKLKRSPLIKCPNCGQPKKSHQVCPVCGYYKGKEVVKPKVKKGKKTT
jgi:large subunit ribosomal protein L32